MSCPYLAPICPRRYHHPRTGKACLAPTSLTIEDRVTTANEARAALERGRAVILVTPPAPDQAAALWDLVDAQAASLGAPAVVIACVDDVSAARWADACPPGRRVHVASGVRRTERCLREEPMDVLAGGGAGLAPPG